MPRRVKQIILRLGTATMKNGDVFPEGVDETGHQIQRADLASFADNGDIRFLTVHVQLADLDRQHFVNSCCGTIFKRHDGDVPKAYSRIGIRSCEQCFHGIFRHAMYLFPLFFQTFHRVGGIYIQKMIRLVSHADILEQAFDGRQAVVACPAAAVPLGPEP